MTNDEVGRKRRFFRSIFDIQQSIFDME